MRALLGVLLRHRLGASPLSDSPSLGPEAKTTGATADNSRRRRRIHSYLPTLTVRRHILLVSVSILIFIIAFITVALALMADARNRIITHRLLNETAGVITAVDAELSRYVSILQTLSLSFDSGEPDFPAMHRLAAAAARLDSNLLTIGLFDPQGRHLFNALEPYGKSLPATGAPDLLDEVRRTGQPAISNLYRGGISGRPLVTIGVPVMREGRVTFVLAAAIEPRALTSLLRKSQPNIDSNSVLLDRNNVVVAHTLPEAGVGTPSANEPLTEGSNFRPDTAPSGTQEGQPTLKTSRRSTLSGWTLVLTATKESFDHEMAILWRQVAIGGAALFLVIFVVLALYGRHVTRALRDLAGAAVALSRRESPAVQISGIAEIDRVGSAVVMAAGERDRHEHALAQAKAKAEAADQAKSQFLAHMSHELRTPLNAIIGFAEMMSNRIGGANALARYAEYARDIQTSGEHLLKLISRILDLSRLEADALVLNETRFLLANAIAECLTMVGPSAEQSGVIVVSAVDSSIEVTADKQALRQIFLNLLSNAIKFSPRGGRVLITARPQPDRGLVISVEDRGIGIPADRLPRIFEPFHSTDATLTSTSRGIGLGLAISQRLAKLHGGTLQVTSMEGVGTTVSLLLPASRATPQASWIIAA